MDVSGKSAQHWVPRIRLYFLSEDPFLYAKRVATAHEARKEAVHAMRYHLCVDSMPADAMYSLSVEQINRVLTLALNSKFLRVWADLCHELTCVRYVIMHLYVACNCIILHKPVISLTLACMRSLCSVLKT